MRYIVFVADDAGWGEGCPDYEDVFFGAHGGRYVAHPESDFGGHVEFRSRRAAEKLLRQLGSSGDWFSRRAGEEVRPTYGLDTIPRGRHTLARD